MKQLLGKTSAVVFLVMGCVGLVAAAFLSNPLTIHNNTVTTGEAAIKFCDTVDLNKWTNSMSPMTVLGGMLPGEERDLYAGRTIYIGNDGGSLSGVLGGSQCNGYAVDANSSNVKLKVIPTVEISEESCPSAIAADLALTVEIAGQSLGYHTIQELTTNTVPVDLLLLPNTTGRFKVTVRFSSTSQAQAQSCAFTMKLVGRQEI